MLYMARLVSRPVINNEVEISENRKKFRNYYQTCLLCSEKSRLDFYEIKISSNILDLLRRFIRNLPREFLVIFRFFYIVYELIFNSNKFFLAGSMNYYIVRQLYHF